MKMDLINEVSISVTAKFIYLRKVYASQAHCSPRHIQFCARRNYGKPFTNLIKTNKQTKTTSVFFLLISLVWCLIQTTKHFTNVFKFATQFGVLIFWTHKKAIYWGTRLICVLFFSHLIFFANSIRFIRLIFN